MPKLVRDIGHILIGVEDMEEALGFYRDLLGLDVIGEVNANWTVVSALGGRFTLYKQDEVIPVVLGPEGNRTPFSLHVHDFEEAADALEAAGVRLGRGDAHHGVVWDPFGNVLELHDHREQ